MFIVIFEAIYIKNEQLKIWLANAKGITYGIIYANF